MSSRWPAVLWLVRHGESAGNVARDAAHAEGLERIDISGRDVDVPLSPRGEQQAAALGHWFADGHEDGRPEILMSSPYRRALQTARLFRDNGGASPDEVICTDERLREKEFGILDGLTTPGVASVYPDQADFRRLLGKFYHRPPGGESWCDVIFRLRSLMDTVSLHYAGKRVMIVAHQVVVLCMRYVIENLDEERILAIDRQADVANCSITEYRYDPAAGKDGNLVLVRYNVTAPMRAESEVTSAPRSDGGGARMTAIRLDAAWLDAHPLPVHEAGTDKNSRGRVLLAGGAETVPGALRLTGEAALRAGAGKLRMATVDGATLMLGMFVPEAATIALPTDRGQIGAAAVPLLLEELDRCDTFVLGPGMGDTDCAATLVEGVLGKPRASLSILLDAAAIACADRFRDTLRGHEGRLVLTPHHGEMAKLTGCERDEIAADPHGAAQEAARRYGAVVALKSGETVIAAPDGTSLVYPGGGVGLATGGSGDVLAGIIGGLLARGASPLAATAWGVWLHGEAGRLLAGRIGRIGFLARELLPEIPRLMDRPHG